jgi:hypothetical protein
MSRNWKELRKRRVFGGKFEGRNAEKGQKKGTKNVVLGSFRGKLLCYNHLNKLIK